MVEQFTLGNISHIDAQMKNMFVIPGLWWYSYYLQYNMILATLLLRQLRLSLLRRQLRHWFRRIQPRYEKKPHTQGGRNPTVLYLKGEIPKDIFDKGQGELSSQLSLCAWLFLHQMKIEDSSDDQVTIAAEELISNETVTGQGYPVQNLPGSTWGGSVGCSGGGCGMQVKNQQTHTRGIRKNL